MKQIPLTKGKTALVDDDDFARLSSMKWTYAQAGTKEGYAVHYYRTGEKVKSVYMHRMVMNAPSGQLLDHKNGNGLDNQKSNLRFCTNVENQRNRRPADGEYKGVKKSHDKWVVHIWINRLQIYLGTFDSAKDAALAYNAAAIKHHGEFAWLNVID